MPPNPPLVEDRQALAAQVQAQLLGTVATARAQLGLSQAELAQRIGRARMTVQRAEAEGAGTTLATFCELALGLGLTPRLQADEGQGDPQVASVAPQDIVHRGLHYNRTQHDQQWRDRQREAAFAHFWETVNEHRPVGLSPVMRHLVPGHTQAQASAVATAVQWLGSEVGFDFLTRALDAAGYDLVDRAEKNGPTPSRRTGKKG